jgi:hypothetical protein
VWTRTVSLIGLASLLVAAPAQPVSAYSVLAHESNIDTLWDAGIRPLLKRRFPQATASELTDARAYAYGGSVIQDLGYYPFGSHFFSNLLHYVRTGDFVETLIRDADTLDEYAFALGALAHYAADNTGHPVAVNRAVPMLFPDLQRKFGDEVTYVESPARHVITEFSFDVVQAASGGYAPLSYHAFIGFQVAKPLLERAIREVYGLEMRDLFASEDLALGSYRRAVGDTLPAITEAAWRDKQEEIQRLKPGVQRSGFVYTLTHAQYDQEFGTEYYRPGFFSRFIAFLYRLLPKIGPLKPLSFKAPTPAAERLFLVSLAETRRRYREALDAVATGHLELANMNFDIGQPTRRGEYPLADDTYRELLEKFAHRKYAGVTPAMRRALNQFYAGPSSATSRKERKREAHIREMLAALNAAAGASPGAS